MSYLAILRCRPSAILSKYMLEKCMCQCLMYQARLHSTGVNNRQKNGTGAKERAAKRKILKARILNDIRQTRQKVEEIIERENIWTIPNFLCVGRMVTSPYLSYLIVSHDYEVALYLLAVVGFSDFADGWIARTWTSQASKLGSFLDPMADKLLVGTLYFSLAWVGLVPVPLTCLIILRDVMLVTAASYIRYRSIPPPKTLSKYFDPTYASVQLKPTRASKVNTGIQLCLVAGSLAAPVYHFVDHPYLNTLCYITAFTTVAAGLSYLLTHKTYKFVKKKRSSPSR